MTKAVKLPDGVRVIKGRYISAPWKFLPETHITFQDYEDVRGVTFLSDLRDKYQWETYQILSGLERLVERNRKFKVGGWRKGPLAGRGPSIFVTNGIIEALEDEIVGKSARRVKRTPHHVHTVRNTTIIKQVEGRDITAAREAAKLITESLPGIIEAVRQLAVLFADDTKSRKRKKR